MSTYYNQIKSPLWQRKRLEIFKRDDFKCTICGSTDKQLQVHHLCYFPNLNIWEYDDELLQTVCDQHHKELTFYFPKVSGLIAFKALQKKIDLLDLLKLVR